MHDEPTSPKQALWVANHRSLLDIPILLQHPVQFVAKASVRRIPIIGGTAARHGVAFVRRGDAHSGRSAFHEVVRHLRAGASVERGCRTTREHVHAILAGPPASVRMTVDEDFVPRDHASLEAALRDQVNRARTT